VDLRFIPEPEPIRSLVCYLGPLRVAGKMSLISIDGFSFVSSPKTVPNFRNEVL